MTIEGVLGNIKIGDLHPVRLMGVVNLSQESFYKRSFAGPDEVLERARALVDEGADFLDLGAVSTAPGSPPIPESEERKRLISPLTKVLENLDVGVSVDTQRAAIAQEALSLGASCVNDVSGLLDPHMAKTVADHDASLVIMASGSRPGDLLYMEEVIQVLGRRLKAAIDAGVSTDKIIIDPGIGHWVPEKSPEHDLALLDGMRRLRVLDKPVMAAVSRKSFIGARLNRSDPKDRLAGSLASTAIAVYNGAHLVRTHDVSASIDVIRMAEAVRGKPALSQKGKVEVEVFSQENHPRDLRQIFDRIQVSEPGSRILVRKGAFRVFSIKGITSMEAVIIKQEMLARGGEAAIPMGALRCDPEKMEVLIMGTVAQIKGLIENLKVQPFNLPAVGETIREAMVQIDKIDRYR